MRFPYRQVAFAGAAILGLLACSSSSSSSDDLGFPPGAVGGGVGSAAESTCTEDAGVLTPIGPQGCAANQTLVYRKPLAGSGASAITSAAGTVQTPPSAMLTACTETKCAPGQVAVVTYQPSASGDPFSTDGGAPRDAATDLGDGAAPVADGSAAPAPDGASSVADGGAALASDGGAPDASALATADASDDATESADAGVIGVPCGAVVTCIDVPPTCPEGQSPSYTPSGKWHCMPLCDSSSRDTVLITYGSTFGNTVTCAGAPPTTACPTKGQVWTWDYEDEEWVCASECDNGQYDQHVYEGRTICVPC